MQRTQADRVWAYELIRKPWVLFFRPDDELKLLQLILVQLKALECELLIPDRVRSLLNRPGPLYQLFLIFRALYFDIGADSWLVLALQVACFKYLDDNQVADLFLIFLCKILHNLVVKQTLT